MLDRNKPRGAEHQHPLSDRSPYYCYLAHPELGTFTLNFTHKAYALQKNVLEPEGAHACLRFLGFPKKLPSDYTNIKRSY